MPRLATLMLALAFLLAPSCDQKQESKSKEKGAKEKSTQTGTKTGTGTGSGSSSNDDCTVPSGSGSGGGTGSGDSAEKTENTGEMDDEEGGGGGDDDEDFGLALTAGVYYADVKSIIEQKCQACHPNYAEYKNAKADAAKSMETINKGTMPPGNPKLTADEKTKFKAWVDGGALEKAAGGTSSGTSSGSSGDDDGSSDDSATNEPAANPCPSGTTDDTASTDQGTTDDSEFKGDPELFKEYLNPPEREACLAKKGCWYRKATADNPRGSCYKNAAGAEATCPATFTCDRAGALGAFSNNPVAVKFLDDYESKGYLFDGCGTVNGKPIIFLTCFHSGDKKCVKPENLVGDSVGMEAQVLSAQ